MMLPMMKLPMMLPIMMLPMMLPMMLSMVRFMVSSIGSSSHGRLLRGHSLSLRSPHLDEIAYPCVKREQNTSGGTAHWRGGLVEKVVERRASLSLTRTFVTMRIGGERTIINRIVQSSSPSSSPSSSLSRTSVSLRVSLHCCGRSSE